MTHDCPVDRYPQADNFDVRQVRLCKDWGGILEPGWPGAVNLSLSQNAHDCTASLWLNAEDFKERNKMNKIN